MTVITGKHYRISFLTSRLVRLEYQEDGCFEDRGTTFARNREFPEVKVTRRENSWGIELDTEHLHLVYNEKPFSSSGLSVKLKGNYEGYDGIWHYGDAVRSLGGTARTLDGADGEIPVDTGVVSESGFSVIDDSKSVLLDPEGNFMPREHPETDLYFFGYGHAYLECLRDYYALTGEVPMVPRFALGNWWSRYHVYTEESYLRLMDRFQQAGIPLSVAVIDMDWHIVANPYTNGWTGYTWNRELFPDPERFLKALHDRGMRTTLNLHPADGVAPHEDAYEAVCRAVGQNPEEKQNVDFNPTDEVYLKAYFGLVHHPLEEQGVDFWWIDWQQGGVCAMEGLDPLGLLNEKHYKDSLRKGKRGLILSRYAGPGSHRCPVGFSGDTVTTWESLAFQPRFTAMASNIGYPWWSHDIGGHMRGIRSDELSVRWLQYGVFSPILRLHSTKSEFMSKEPWSFGRETERIMTEWLRFRHRLVPYLYTAAERTHRLGEPLVQPMYYGWPEEREAYRVPNQYLFGTELMVCPITEPARPELGLASTEAWLPEGRWFDIFSGQIYTGNRVITLWRGPEGYPVLAKAGAILPLSDEAQADRNPAALTLRVFAGADNTYTLYEDDGESLDSPAARTRITLDWQNGMLCLEPEGELSLIPEKRTWQVECIGFTDVPVTVNGSPTETTYDPDRNALCFLLEAVARDQQITVSFPGAETAKDDWLERTRRRLQQTQSSTDEKHVLWDLLAKQKRSAALLGSLQNLCTTPGMAGCLTETVFAQDE